MVVSLFLQQTWNASKMGLLSTRKQWGYCWVLLIPMEFVIEKEGVWNVGCIVIQDQTCGICINGAIDGYSRHIVWLEAYTTNSDPRIIGSYFIKAVEVRTRCSRTVRADNGTENGHVETFQKFVSGQDDAFIYVSSNHNQRLEAWWCFLRRHVIQYWMNLLGNTFNPVLFHAINPYTRYLLYSFI